MYVTIHTYRNNAALMGSLIEHEFELRNMVREIRGFQAYYLIQTASGEAVAISVYDSQGAGEEASRQAVEFIREHLPEMSADAPEVTAGESVVNF